MGDRDEVGSRTKGTPGANVTVEDKMSALDHSYNTIRMSISSCSNSAYKWRLFIGAGALESTQRKQWKRYREKKTHVPFLTSAVPTIVTIVSTGQGRRDVVQRKSCRAKERDRGRVKLEVWPTRASPHRDTAKGPTSLHSPVK